MAKTLYCPKCYTEYWGDAKNAQCSVCNHKFKNKQPKQLNKILTELLDDLGWEYDRMSSSGKETLYKLWKLLDLPNFEDIEKETKK